MGVDRPKPSRKLLSALTDGKWNTWQTPQPNNLRDRLIISLLGDSGMRLSELASIKDGDMDWENYTITIVGKGNKQRKAPFTARTATMLREYLNIGHTNRTIWDINRYGIQTMLKRLAKETGIACNAHSFRRGFACNLHRKGLSTLDIMHLGGWEDLDMVLKYTRSITFEDCLEQAL